MSRKTGKDIFLEDEKAIRSINHAVIDYIKTRDYTAITEFYDVDAAFLLPGSPAFVGIEAIRAAWKTLSQTPGISLEAEPETIEFAESGDLAMDRGWYRLTTMSDGESVLEQGKYLVVWRKKHGEWKMIADMINANA
ncbi:nuclear transport factor 2 family protein [Paraburkholderia acidicola]|uniref:Nuclear transport factor 2 family protein n=1 Tax=Paraburkholderia acidicola TaxID=1912599 RepID=A0ABV1LX34_9BURK